MIVSECFKHSSLLCSHNNTIAIVVMCSPTCVNGVCIYPGVCLCDEGWIDEDCSRGEKEYWDVPFQSLQCIFVCVCVCAHTHMHTHTHTHARIHTAVCSALCAYMRVCNEVIVIAVRIVRPLWCGIGLLYMHLQRYASLHVYMGRVISARDIVTAILDTLASLVVKVR